MIDRDKTDRLAPISRCPKRDASSVVSHHLEQALAAASIVGHDIHDAITKLLASVRRREVERKDAA